MSRNWNQLFESNTLPAGYSMVLVHLRVTSFVGRNQKGGCKMKAIEKSLIVGCVGCLLFAGITRADPVEKKKPLVQIAVLLDTSNSMDGLIAQAKTQLWKIVNQFIAAKKDGLRPEIQVALVEYGKQSLPVSEGFIRVIQPLTADLDKVSEELFALTTNGGDEYCGQVIQVATRNLNWSKNPQDLKVIVIAGNEAFTQGSVSYKESCKESIAKGIMVNTIFCGSRQEGIDTSWMDGAVLADGHYLNIDQNQQVAQIAAPQDAEISRLGAELNTTYIAVGTRGKAAKARQEAQDQNAASSAPAVMAERAAYKSSEAYGGAASDWDLAQAVKDKKVDLGKVEEETLPDEMKGMDAAARKAYVEKQIEKRALIQKKIQSLSDERKKFITEKEKEQAKSGENTLDAAMIQSIRSEAQKKNFQFE
jgi:hypothetical protein